MEQKTLGGMLLYENNQLPGGVMQPDTTVIIIIQKQHNKELY